MDCFPASSPLIDRLYENGVNTDYKTVMEVTPTVTHPSAGYEKISDASRIEQPRRVPVLPGFLPLIAPRAAPVPSRIGTVSRGFRLLPLATPARSVPGDARYATQPCRIRLSGCERRFRCAHTR